MPREEFGQLTHVDAGEGDQQRRLLQLFQQSPIPPGELLRSLGLYASRPVLSRLLFFADLYRKLVDVHGVILEFGVRWGQDMALLTCLRDLFEPQNFGRRIVGFDTFRGFPSVHAKDAGTAAIAPGDYTVTPGYSVHLAEVLAYHQSLSARPQIQRFELVEGDVLDTFPRWLEENPEAIVAMAYFDLDLYEPTKQCLELLKPRLTRGGVLGFDELNVKEYPGETVAVREVLGLSTYRFQRSAFATWQSFAVIDCPLKGPA
jgi:hypothetical protein